METTLIYPDRKGAYCATLVTALSLEAVPDADAAPDANGALAAVNRASAPAPKAEIVKALTRLRLRTKARRETTEDMAAAFALYAEDLATFPADAVHETLEGWPRRENGMWWPSWSELDGVLRAKASFRRRARAALVTFLEDRTEAEPADPKPTEQERP
ncbi:MAG: hypothetical protein AAFX92_02120 [Pseudomonadota bacterium]